jgi:hypothetical protein
MQGKVFVCQAEERLTHPASKVAVDGYGAALNDYDGLQLPLYRMVETPSGTVFLSVVMAEPGVNVAALIVSQDREAIIDYDVDATGVFLLLKKQLRWYSLAMPAVLKDPPIAVSYTSTDSASVHTWHAKREALQRIGDE